MRQCPTHNKELKAGKNGSYFCATKVGEGWCKYREFDQASKPAPRPEGTNDVILREMQKQTALLTGIRNLLDGKNMGFSPTNDETDDINAELAGLSH